MVGFEVRGYKKITTLNDIHNGTLHTTIQKNTNFFTNSINSTSARLLNAPKKNSYLPKEIVND